MLTLGRAISILVEILQIKVYEWITKCYPHISEYFIIFFKRNKN